MSSEQGENETSIKDDGNDQAESSCGADPLPLVQQLDGSVTEPLPSPDSQNDPLFGILPMKDVELYLKAVAGLVGVYFVIAPQRFLLTVWNILMTTVGVTLGIGLGAGLAMHVFHQLQSWQKDYDNRGSADYGRLKAEKRRQLVDQIRPNKSRYSILRGEHSHESSFGGLNGLAASTSSSLEDGNSYVSLMTQAGYYVPDRVLRGQVLREDHKFWRVKYRFTDNMIPDQRAVKLVATDWPSLPEPVTREMGRFIEHIMRDFVSGWYSSLDDGVVYRDEQEKREAGIPRDGGDDDEKYYRKESATPETPMSPKSKTTPGKRLSFNKRETMASSVGAAAGISTRLSQVDAAAPVTSVATSLTTPTKKQQEQNEEKQQPHHHVPRRMVFSTLTHRNVPMIDCTYRVMSAAFGNLASRAEHVNVLELAILKWTQILGRSFKVYRTLRKAAQDKNNNAQSPSEVQVTREFLLAGKLHRAVVFGLDVPSLLFADASGEECGCGTDQTPQGQLHVLEQRLYHTEILKECELDYNRVVANRLVRALLPKSESASTCVTSLVVEIIAGCVLQPIMNLWVPSFLNHIIVKAMDKPAPTGLGNDDGNKASSDTATDSLTDSYGDQVNKRDEARPVAAHEPNTVTSALDQGSSDCEGTEGQIEQGGRTEHDGQSVIAQAPNELFNNASTSNQPACDNSDENEVLEEIEGHGSAPETSHGDKLLALSATALEELGKQMDFDECRRARENHQETDVDWDDADVGSVVLRLVMVVEAVMLDGRCEYREPVEANERLDPQASSNPDDQISDTDEMEKESFVQLLMEMTSDLKAFENRLDGNGKEGSIPITLIDHPSDEFEPNANEISTLRTLISTWLHTGQLLKAFSLIDKAASTLFAPFYASDAFLMEQANREKFLELIKVLDGVDVMVETMAVLASQRLAVEEEFVLLASRTQAAPPKELLNSPGRSGHLESMHPDHGFGADAYISSLTSSFGGQSKSRYQDFHRNEAFAASLRAERERRLRAWETTKADDGIMTVIRRTATKKMDLELHRELHKLAFVLYNGTSLTTIRDAARKSDADQSQDSNAVSDEKVSLLTVETALTRRRIEVPDDDSSFLLRAQSRPLNPLSVHRDDRNHDMSYKCFLATYEEPAIAPGSTRYNGGRFIRRCFLQYYPSDRTASIAPMSDARKLDKRKSKLVSNDEGGKDLAASFVRQRHLCQKWTQSGGVSTKSFFDSKLMDPGDFVSSPRSGKAIEFVYKKILFEPPVVELGGKRFTVQDSSAGRGVHRADASALEVSDASLSHLLLLVGKEYEAGQTGRPIECGPDGYPMLFQKHSSKHGDHVNTEIKPYRLSFVRAALMIASSRHEAQLQSLVDCVKAGSAKSATKARTEEQLRPTLKILDFANNRPQDLSLILRPYHIDKEQLRRNEIWSPRESQKILELGAKVESTALARDVPLAKLLNPKLHPDETLYKVRCVALIRLDLDVEDTTHELEPYLLDDGSYAQVYREEWVVYRSMKDFQALHKQLKSQVASTESTMSTGTRIVGAATAALSSRNLGRRSNKKILIPSLASATKTGIAMTKRSAAKRMELLNEYVGYLFSSNSLMNRSAELLLFLGASHPFPREVTVTKAPANVLDPLGRMNFIRSVALRDAEGSKLKRRFLPHAIRKETSSKQVSVESEIENKAPDPQVVESGTEIADMDPSILNKVDQVPLTEVRNRLVEFMRFSFGFENASFMRSQMLSVLETASFVAMAKQSSFRRLLHDLHAQHLNGEAVGRWIAMVMDMLWPDGVWGKSAPPFTPEEEKALEAKSRVTIHEGFPEQFRSLLGKELVSNGLDMIHEMLQNKIILKSLFYMLFDLLWIEVFPELRDTLPCASSLDLDLL